MSLIVPRMRPCVPRGAPHEALCLTIAVRTDHKPMAPVAMGTSGILNGVGADTPKPSGIDVRKLCCQITVAGRLCLGTFNLQGLCLYMLLLPTCMVRLQRPFYWRVDNQKDQTETVSVTMVTL